MPTIRKIGVLTGGGDAPGLNAVIRAVVKSACNSGIEVIGLEDSFDGLIYPEMSRVLTPKDVTGILRLGGTILGTVNRGDPFAEPITTPQGTFNYGERVLEMFSPDFYLPELDQYVELTTLRQRLVTKKNRKLRLLRELYPHINVRLLYRKD